MGDERDPPRRISARADDRHRPTSLCAHSSRLPTPRVHHVTTE
jgi:hypothetical protein